MKISTILIIFVILVTPWLWNVVKFVSCDFESDWKCEVIHGVGVVVPPAAYITVWFATDS